MRSSLKPSADANGTRSMIPRFKPLAAWHQKWARRQRDGGDQGLTKTLADEILRTDHFAKDAGGELYSFEGGCYRPNGEERIARQVKRLLELNGDTARWSSHRAREVSEYLRVDAPALWERPPSTVMNLTNGLLDVTTGTLAPHSSRPSVIRAIARRVRSYGHLSALGIVHGASPPGRLSRAAV